MKIIEKALKKIKSFVRRNETDKDVIKRLYRERMGEEINLKAPKKFSEKLNWLKLYDRKPIYTTMVDKYEVKKYVANKIGEEHIIPSLGVYDKFEDIDFSALPDNFVLKCTHNSGGIIICKGKENFNYEKAKEKINNQLNHDFYRHAIEWPYKNVKRRIIAEKYMENGGQGLVDYKFYCFNGNPEFLYISKGLDNHATASISFVNLDWTFAPYERGDFKPFDKLPEKPSCFEEMIEIAKKLSNGLKFIRVDLYEIEGKVYFSELTFYPCAGFMKFKNPEHDLIIGEMLKIK